MLPTTWAPAHPSHLLAVALLAGLVALVLARALWHVGFRLAETSMLLLAAPVLSSATLPWALLERDGSIVLVNVAGFLVPLLIAVKVVAERRVPLDATLVAVAAVALVCYPVSLAVPDEGILLYYRIPAVVAGLVAVSLCWRRWKQAGLVAFIAGSLGVILGADLARLPELLDAEGARRVVLGGAGVLDGIFLVGLLGALVAVCVAGADRFVQALRRKPAARPPSREPEPVAAVTLGEFTWLPPVDRARPGGGAD